VAFLSQPPKYAPKHIILTVAFLSQQVKINAIAQFSPVFCGLGSEFVLLKKKADEKNFCDINS